MAVTMTQQHISTGMPYSDPDYIRRKPKQDLQSHQVPEAKNYRYKYPVNPKNRLKISVLKVLVSMQVFLNRPNDRFSFHAADSQ